MIPKIKDIEIPLLKLLYEHDYLSWDDCTDKLSNLFNLSREEKLSIMPNGTCSKMKYRVGWAKANLKKSGLVAAKSRGVYCLTNIGKKYVKDNCL